MELNAANVARHKISEKLNDVEFLDSPKKIRSCLRSVASRSAVDFTGNQPCALSFDIPTAERDLLTIYEGTLEMK